MKIILLILIGLNLLNADFIKSGDIVKESVSNLEFQDDMQNTTMTWQSALSYCENLTLGGYSDWRLPSINELKAIVDRSKIAPAIVSTFTNTGSNNYWSATTTEYNKTYAWTLRSYYGDIDYVLKTSSNGVRCVRDGQ